MLHIDRDQLTLLEAILTAETPRESCALLLGPWFGATCRPSIGAMAGPEPIWIAAVWPCLNVWDPPSERHGRFAVDPREQLMAQKWGRQRGWQLIGTAHSHPGGQPVPSPLDRSLAVAPTLMLIAGATGQSSPLEPAGVTIRAWWLTAGDDDPAEQMAAARPLTIRIGDLGH
ncbi:M67 family metallopeptidase [Synechococcus sp. CS-1325]|nr:M67 family metallopeptidase [Synechococcus sp. CS-1325]MCT0213796.1 M67 family metallopeptidase [Synechococcus sp. CS-1326]MCT0229322.1 M67 family metallopeptidase [Synechococcus sp. CS-1324]MCT0233826.1 M67 family metallopeptidase [Synechococcus sp. CS-1327]PZU96820.1 MAG: hypothetical protein DCF24_13605 [Cyanobium sp.]